MNGWPFSDAHPLTSNYQQFRHIITLSNGARIRNRCLKLESRRMARQGEGDGFAEISSSSPPEGAWGMRSSHKQEGRLMSREADPLSNWAAAHPTSKQAQALARASSNTSTPPQDQLGETWKEYLQEATRCVAAPH
jgi:hypothetical protein